MKRIAWIEQAMADVRGLDKLTAMRILSALHRLLNPDAPGSYNIVYNRPAYRRPTSRFRAR